MSVPREINLLLKVESDGKVEIQKAWEEGQAHKIPNGLPADLNIARLKGHNAIGVLVSNPTCFLVGGKIICI